MDTTKQFLLRVFVSIFLLFLINLFFFPFETAKFFFPIQCLAVVIIAAIAFGVRVGRDAD